MKMFSDCYTVGNMTPDIYSHQNIIFVSESPQSLKIRMRNSTSLKSVFKGMEEEKLSC